MATSIFIAKLLGPIFLVIGLGLFANRQAYRTMAEQFLHSPPLVYLSGVMALLGGLAIVLTHDVWTFDWRILVTLIGWLALVRGALRIVLPEWSMAMAAKMVARDDVLLGGTVAAILIGVILSFYGYLS